MYLYCYRLECSMSEADVIFCFKDTAPSELYTNGHTLSLHDALPISLARVIASGAALWLLDEPANGLDLEGQGRRSEEHTSELQSLMRISYAVFCLKKKK